ncbi:hypothetical protein [Aequorivita viscosa]|uniref:BlaR1 peptidase M56 n=1 Tax=Aequorivita viscosa TaxID=797419 RepID=A0A1M6E073_9FLAO|nr:hypothetical protein [Aequorivita viscosa]SDW47233.1 hypothetical protein SAMN05216556_10612 [Aequorivita viscosa]SHI78785.1 hypothetical protein SAMN04487908_105160 [Aequorivita viscosa]
MILLVRPKFLRKNFNGIALWPFVIVRNPDLSRDFIFLNHEQIHLRQQIELLVIFFYVWYGMEFLLRWISYKNRNLAYRNISFEREAYACEKNLNYLKKRTFWSFLKYL